MKRKLLSLIMILSLLVQTIIPVEACENHGVDLLSLIEEFELVNNATSNQVTASVNSPDVLVEECELDHSHDETCSHSIDEVYTGITGNISATLYFDFKDKLENVEDRNLFITLIKDDEELGIASLSTNTTSIAGYPLSIVAKTLDGNTNLADDIVGQYSIEISSLPIGIYAIELNGTNHVTYRTENIEMNDFAKHVTLGTGNATFTYGDVFMDGKINNSDLDVIKSDIVNEHNIYDLNGDGVVNVVDLTMISVAMNATGEEVVFDTYMIGLSEKIDFVDLNLALADYSVDGNVESVFESGNDTIINISTKDGSFVSEENPIIIPITLSEGIEMSQIEIVTPISAGSIQSGYVEVVYEEDGEDVVVLVPFDISTEGIMLMTLEPNVIVINLGTRVVVKSITVTVEEVIGAENEYVAIQEVVFIKDIVPEFPDASNALINNIVITANNKALSISWDKADNVGGYRIRYGTESGKYTYTKETTVNSVSLTGLENLTKYYIVIEATSGSWTGTTSDEVVGIPQPSSVPGVPTSIVVVENDTMLQLSWQEPLNADTYNVYLKETSQDDSEYELIASGFTSTSYTIRDLTNDVSYTFRLSSSNIKGEGQKTSPIEATPAPFVIEDPILPTTDRIDNSYITSAWLNNSSNVNSSGMPNGFNASFVYDEDYSTYWMASSYSLDSGINFTFSEANDMSYMIYVPRLDGATKTSYLNVTSFSVRVWLDGDDLSSNGRLALSSGSSSYRLDENGTPYYVIQFNDVFEDVVKLCVYANERTGAGRVNLSDAVFYKHSSLASDVADLFSNDSFTEIKSTVSESQLQALEIRVAAAESYVVNQAVLGEEIKLARALLNNEDDALGYVKTDIVSINNSSDDRTLSGISPLGIVGLARTDLSIYADIPEGETIYVYPSQYFAGPGTFAGNAVKLVSGRNIVNVEDLTDVTGAIEGGAFYYTYSGDKADEITLHILNYCGVYQGINTPIENIQIPTLELYDLGDLASCDQTELRNRVTAYIEYFDTYTGKTATSPTLNPINATEISTKSVLLSVPAAGVWSALGGDSASVDSKVDQLINALLAWDELIYVTHTAYGDDEGERQGRQSIRYMKMSASAFMYAAGNHIGIQYGSVASTVSGTPTSVTGTGNANNLYGWGFAHEIGHNLDRLGILEVTNNIYSQLALTWDGVDGIGLTTNRIPYSDVFAKVSVGSAGIPNNVFLQLGMYWQLHLAYSDENILEFYTAFNKAYKNGEYSNYSGYNRTAVISSSIAGKNLTDFFTSWGITLSQEAKDEMSQYPDETRKIQYLTDDERIYRLTSNRNGIESVDDYTVYAGFDSEDPKQLSLSIFHTMDWTDLQGFEVYRDDECVGFTTNNTFTDYIGSYNNSAFTYSVQAVDKLGYLVGDRMYADEVRIEYDDVISSTAYVVEAIEGGFRYTFTSATSTSGVIIKNAPNNGLFNITITSEVDGELTDAMLVKAGDFEVNETLTGDLFKNYFVRPDADLDDTRISVYDAKIIEITGITSQQEVEFIASVGDNVTFTDYMIGRLGHDFDTGNGIISAGDIVIIGEYIGDPYFNEIVLYGMYANSTTEEVGMEYIERPMAGTTYMFATVPENGAVSVISDGLFIFVPDIQNEGDLQGVDGTTCGGASLLPAQMKAIMNRTSDTGTRQTSATLWVNTPTDDTLPTIILQ